MNSDFLSRFLLGSLAVNYGILLIWFLAFAFAKDWMRGLHGRWFHLSDNPLPGKQIDDNGQIQPAFPAPNVGDVANIRLNSV